MNYKYSPGDRVYCDHNNKFGTISFGVPGDGTMPWYVVDFDDNTEETVAETDLEPC